MDSGAATSFSRSVPDTTPEAVLASLKSERDVIYVVNRSGEQFSVASPRPYLPLIGLVAPNSAAAKAGLQVGDVLAQIDGKPLFGWSDLQRAVATSKGEVLEISVQRAGQSKDVSLAPVEHDGVWRIGVGAAPLYELKREVPSVNVALGQGISQTAMLFERTAGGLAMSALGRGDPCALDGPLAIGRVTGQAIQLGPEVFLTFMAVISLGLGLLNLLPIPILDGGHLLMLGIEGTTGRAVGKRLQAVLFIGGVTLIVFLMLTATINDLRCRGHDTGR